MTTVTQLTEQIERALRAGRVVTVGDRTLRYCRRNQEFTDDQGNHFQALANGVYLQMDVYDCATGFKEPLGKTWGFALPIDDLDILIGEQLKAMGQKELDTLSLELAFTAGLASLRTEDAQRRRAPEAAFDEPQWSPSI